METEQLLHLILNVTEEFKGQDLSVLKVDEVCDFADYFVIITGTSTRHVQSLAEEIVLKCKHAGSPAFSVEGMDLGEWCLMDFSDIVVHIFLPEKRAHYDLESLWEGARSNVEDDGDEEEDEAADQDS